ncbi:post-transcriptional regulator [Paenibacillus sp. JX-17]|uniref:Post-transcriptional regulator n=1 Tax=Paenibacillus lacisoli TaxID=3064525 RepID=A0ABT9CFV4_9BACL|nr:post-transcriptional regulator [Paenibacillus sp. JX-17]MDO7908086.1 post-transcriptional regulator [Paenibacillus sp. JX-17]
MTADLEYEYWDEDIETLCQSKAEELRLVGYEYVTSKDVWECISHKYEKDGIPPLHRLVNDILSLKATGFMNYMTLSALRGSTFE